MKYHTHLRFRTGLSLEELADIVKIEEPDFDAENEDEWVIGRCDGVDNIDICRTHLVPPMQTETIVLRYAHAMESVIPQTTLRKIALRLKTAGISEISVTGFDKWEAGFISNSCENELGV